MQHEYRDAPGSVITADVYHANLLMPLSDEAIVERMASHIAACEPGFKAAKVVDSAVLRFPKAVTHFSPGSHEFRWVDARLCVCVRMCVRMCDWRGDAQVSPWQLHCKQLARPASGPPGWWAAFCGSIRWPPTSHTGQEASDCGKGAGVRGAAAACEVRELCYALLSAAALCHGVAALLLLG